MAACLSALDAKSEKGADEWRGTQDGVGSLRECLADGRPAATSGPYFKMVPEGLRKGPGHAHVATRWPQRSVPKPTIAFVDGKGSSAMGLSGRAEDSPSASTQVRRVHLGSRCCRPRSFCPLQCGEGLMDGGGTAAVGVPNLPMVQRSHALLLACSGSPWAKPSPLPIGAPSRPGGYRRAASARIMYRD